MVAVLKRLLPRRLLVATTMVAAPLAVLPPTIARAQQGRPSAEQVQAALQNDPALVEKVKSKIMRSGMTPDQIRARLRAAGYPEHMLDAYMSGQDSTGAAAAPTDSVLQAVRFLGLVDAEEMAARQQATTRTETAREREEASTRVFGLDIFRRSTNLFEPDVAGPVDQNYRVGPRDVLALILTGSVENSYTLEVTREGFVVIPQVGQVYVANMTLEQVDDVLLRRLQTVYSGIGRGPNAGTHFFVTVAKLRTNQVFVVGDAAAPGSYQVSSAGTALTALYAAGGPSDNGSLRGVEVRRAGRTIGKLDVYDYLTKGDASKDLRLETGDVVFVPVHGAHVQVLGEVIRPAIYELSRGETLADLMRMAGGFTAKAGRRRVLVHRIVPPSQRTEGGRDRTTLDISSDQLATGYGPTIPLEDGDQVEVFGVPDRVRNLVNVQGAVWSPGPQGFAAGMKLSDAIKRAGGVRPDVKDALISRLLSDQSRQQLRATFVDTLGTVAKDIELQEDDSVQVFGTSDFRPDRYVAITGAVNNGGRFPYRQGMTLRDLVHLAGGFGDGAYLVSAEVARLPDTHEDGTLAHTLTVPLDSTYLLERGLDGRYSGPPGMQTLNSKAADFELMPYDNVLILRQPDWQLDRSVTITGEVKFPGTYALQSKNERVSDLVKRAGGVLQNAYIAGAVFTRPNGDLGRIGVDLDRALRDANSRDNFVLLPGDTLYIPRYRPTVKVEGAVNSPIAVAYVPGKNLKYYIDAAGGQRFDADLYRSYVRQPNGIVEAYRHHVFMVPDHKPSPDAGAVVVVPTRDPNEKKDWTAFAGAVAQILASTVAIAAIALK